MPQEENILIVGSDAILLAQLDNILGKFNLAPTLAMDSISAVHYCQYNRFELILVTATGHPQDTLQQATQVCQPQLKTNQPFKTPLVMLDPDKLLQSKKALSLAGIDEHITEPVSDATVIDVLSNWMGYRLSDHNDTFKTLLAHPVELAECLKRSQQSTKLAKDVLRVLIGDLEAQKKEIQTLHQKNDRQGLQALTHKIQGSCHCSGVPLLSNQIQRLEKLLNQNDRVNTDLIVSNLLRAISQLQDWNEQHDIDALFE